MSTSEDKGGGKRNQFATFRIGKTLFGVDVHNVQEVIKSQQLTPVPLASEVVSGLINLRGQIITAIDLRRRLGKTPEKDSEVMNIIVRVDDDTVSLLVDSVGDVLELSNDQFEPTPPTIRGPLRDLSAGVFKLSGELMLLLNTNAAVQV